MSTYTIVKSNGCSRNIQVVNRDTSRSVIIGTPTYEIVDMINKSGDLTDTIVWEAGELDVGEISVYDRWEFNVSEQLAKDLSSLAFPIHKPKRTKVKATHQKDNSQINALDVLFGLAHYN